MESLNATASSSHGKINSQNILIFCVYRIFINFCCQILITKFCSISLSFKCPKFTVFGIRLSKDKMLHKGVKVEALLGVQHYKIFQVELKFYDDTKLLSLFLVIEGVTLKVV